MTEKTLSMKLLGWDELQETLNYNVLVQPEMETARDTVVGRMMRGGKGLGAQNNTLSATVLELNATVTTTLNWPRTKGTAWAQYQEKVVKGIVARNAIKKAIERIEARWAQGG